MKIKMYIKPGEDPNAIAEAAKRLIERNTNRECYVRITGTTPQNQQRKAQ